MYNEKKKSNYDIKQGREISDIKIIQSLQDKLLLMKNTCSYFFRESGLAGETIPFKGFLLYGQPGTGKTELVKQLTRELDYIFGNNFAKVNLVFIDGSVIATPKWGEAEQRLHEIFSDLPTIEKMSKKEEKMNSKFILLFDDIESLMLGRGVQLAKEWHYSINSVFFHELDRVNPNNTIVIATTNRNDLVDSAIIDRLYPIEIPLPPFDDIQIIVNEFLDSTIPSKQKKEEIRIKIIEKLKSLDKISIRDAKKITIIECIEHGVWI